jgi:hypothetical protein
LKVIGARGLVGGLLLVLSVAFPWAGQGAGQGAGQALGDEDLSIGRMRVSIWPEHDDPGVLVIYDGRFADDSRFPTTTTFFIPKGAVINDACSLSPGGQHFCQLYEIVEGDTMDEVIVSLPFSNFYLGIHTLPLDIESEQRGVEFTIRANHPIASLEVDIEQPLRSVGFAISPSGGEPSEQNGFNHFGYALENISKGEERVFRIGYTKKDPTPSVDIKYSSMTGSRVWGSPYDTQRKVKTFIYILFGTGIAAAAGLSWIVFLRKRRKGIGRA